ncbi:MAG: hypothetical protein MUD14_08980 [Hydrococcus sp. Prado102]|nr:hypothetical protein [Hydrococcus sp. Prado102]
MVNGEWAKGNGRQGKINYISFFILPSALYPPTDTPLLSENAYGECVYCPLP